MCTKKIDYLFDINFSNASMCSRNAFRPIFVTAYFVFGFFPINCFSTLIIYVAPLTLLFYGLSCVHASKYTIGGVRYLGITIILIGLIATYFTGYGLLFWAIGFGLCHIIYGALMYFKYEG